MGRKRRRTAHAHENAHIDMQNRDEKRIRRSDRRSSTPYQEVRTAENEAGARQNE